MGALMAGVFAVEQCPFRAQARSLEFLQSRAGQKLSKMVASNPGIASRQRGFRFGAKLFRELRKKKALARVLRSQSLLPSKILRDLIEALVPDIDIRDLSTPLQIVTVDLRSGQRVVLDSGPLRRAIRASMSIPGVFPAVRVDGKVLSDIGVYDSVPCDIPSNSLIGRKTDSDGTIAVDVGQRLGDNNDCQTAFDCLMRFQALAEQSIRQKSLRFADHIIRPDFPMTEWFDFSQPEAIIEAGYVAAEETMKSWGHPRSRSPIPATKSNVITASQHHIG